MYFNLGKGSWGQFWPQRSKTRHYFLSTGVKYDSRTHVGVKIDPRNPFTWLLLGTLTKVKWSSWKTTPYVYDAVILARCTQLVVRFSYPDTECYILLLQETLAMLRKSYPQLTWAGWLIWASHNYFPKYSKVSVVNHILSRKNGEICFTINWLWAALIGLSVQILPSYFAT